MLNNFPRLNMPFAFYELNHVGGLIRFSGHQICWLYICLKKDQNYKNIIYGRNRPEDIPAIPNYWQF